MILRFCYESPLFSNTLSCEVKKRNKYVIFGGGVLGWSRVLFQKKINLIGLISWTTVKHPLCVSCPFNMRYSNVLTGTCTENNRSTTQVERTSTDAYRIHTGCLTHENRTNHIQTHKKRSSTKHFYTVASV